MKNKYGLDVNYFKKELQYLEKSLDNRTPEELFRYLQNLSKAIEIRSEKKQESITMICGICGATNIYGTETCIKCGIDFTWKYDKC